MFAPLLLRDSFSFHPSKRSFLAHFEFTQLSPMGVVLIFANRYLRSHFEVGQSTCQIGRLIRGIHGVSDGLLSDLISFQRLVPACCAVLPLFLLQEAAGDVVLLDIVRDVVDVLVAVGVLRDLLVVWPRILGLVQI